MASHWEHFYHGADIGVRGIGETLEQAYTQAAIALTAIVADPSSIRPLKAVGIACVEPDPELLLVDWLNAVIYEMAVRNMLFSQFDVVLGPQGMTARACGEPIDRSRHRPAVEPKGATCTELRVRRQDDGSWVAQCVVDV